MHLERFTVLPSLPEDTVIQMIVQLLRDVGDEWDEEVRNQGEVEIPGGLILPPLPPRPPTPPLPHSLSPPLALLLLLALPALQAVQPPCPGRCHPLAWGHPVGLSCFSGSSLSSRSGTWPGFCHAPYNFKALSKKWLHKTHPQRSSGRNPRRGSPGGPLLIRSMAPRSPGEQGLRMLPAPSPGHPRGPASCTCASGAIGPPSPAASVSRLTVTIAILRLPPALAASPGLELATRNSQPS